uniref:G_PROTEIN_RECEP_F1_2 domain-containing protein n=1 Tax=Steinernema glaseri TaxID=37863 RepID=A0A1I7ZL03_9BILA
MSPSPAFDEVFNRLLDVAALFHFPLKVTTMYVVYRHSPAEMGAMPAFLLNIMLWNLLANVLGFFMHINPQFPALCFRGDGPITFFTKSEFVYHVFVSGTFACIMDCGLALGFAFPYRYLVFVHPDFVNKIRMKWGICLCVSLHVIYTVTFVYTYKISILSYENYPWKDELLSELPSKAGVICYWPYGWRKNMIQTVFFTLTSISVSIITIFSFMLRRALVQMKHILNEQTLELHRKFLCYLMIITGVPLIFGGIPVLISNTCALFPHISNCRQATMVCTLILYNHGALYSIVSIVTFGPYRSAMYRIVRKSFRPCRSNAVRANLFVAH